MQQKDPYKPVIVYSGNAVDAHLIRAYLQSGGIEAFVQDEMSGTLLPYAASVGGVGAVKVLVAIRDREEAQKMVQEFLNNLRDN